MVVEGDSCPVCGEPLRLARGIEVGNIFQLGTKYSTSLGATFLDVNGKEKPFVMGSYGVGISRTVAAIVEQYHDEKGINWPLVAAPYHAIITVVNSRNEEQAELGEKLYSMLTSFGVETLLDDRNERVGVKFNDRDLIGVPVQITVGKKAAEGVIEFSLRSSDNKEEITVDKLKGRIEGVFAEAGLKL
jgi:prolyl-tRNA synthetase